MYMKRNLSILESSKKKVCIIAWSIGIQNISLVSDGKIGASQLCDQFVAQNGRGRVLLEREES